MSDNAEETNGNGSEPESGEMAAIVHRNIAALLERRQAEERSKNLEDKIAHAITRFTGSMPFVYLHLAIFGIWMVWNLRWLPGLHPFDPSFGMLTMAATVEAIFLATFVLISQNRMQSMADKRAELDLHISLLAEHEVTRVLTLLTAIGERLKVAEARNPELKELAKDVAPEKVLDRMDEAEREGKG